MCSTFSKAFIFKAFFIIRSTVNLVNTKIFSNVKKDLLIFMQIVSIIIVSKNGIRKIVIPTLYSKY